MSATRAEFAELSVLFNAAEYLVSLEDPYFITGFQAISMQSYRLRIILDRLQHTHANLTTTSNILLANVRALRGANPGKRAKGTFMLRRKMGNPRLFTESDNENQENVKPVEIDREEEDLEVDSHEARLEFEREDYALRHRLAGIKILSDIVDEFFNKLSLRLGNCQTLEKIGIKWSRGILESYDVARIADAEKEITDGSKEYKDALKMLEVLPHDFSHLCGSKKRKLALEWVSGNERSPKRRMV